MFKKTAISTLICAAMALSAASAQAFTIQSGDYKMTIDGYANISRYGSSCGTAAACNGAVSSAATGATGSEDGWGILSIATIVNTTNNSQYFTRGTDGYIIGAMTGLTDFSVGAFGPLQFAYATGGAINFYTSASNYDPSVSSLNQAAVIASVTNLPLWLSLDFVAGVANDAAGLLATYTSNYNNSASAGTGSGSGFLAVTGGAAAGAFNTNTLTTEAGNSADASFIMSISKPTPGDVGNNNWLGKTTGDISGYSVPEPGSMALAGLGLLGLAGLRRRKAQA